MDFRAATEELRSLVLMEKIAAAIGVTPQEVRKMIGTSGRPTLNPPLGWEIPIAGLARQQAEKLIQLADTLISRT